MAEKRRDKKGRVLRTGENQRADGRYEYKYTDSAGVRRSVYSWRLVETDRLPDGKHRCEPLRSIEERLHRDFLDGIDSYRAQTMTLDDCYKMRMKTMTKLKYHTIHNIESLYNSYIQTRIQHVKVSAIKPSMVTEFYLDLLDKRGLAPCSIVTVHAKLSSILNFAIKNDIIRKNPATLAMSILKEQDADLWSYKPRSALTIEQQQAISRFFRVRMETCMNEKVGKNFFRKYMMVGSMVNVIARTGLRISELLGLTWADCDFSKDVIDVNHAIHYLSKNGQTGFSITPPKSKSGNREIGMSQDVRKILLMVKAFQEERGYAPSVEIDGYSDFVFRKEDGSPFKTLLIDHDLQTILSEYTEEEIEKAKKECREPILIDSISTHIFRHTFCSRLIEAGANLEWLHVVMGHKDSTITEHVYIHADKSVINEKLKAVLADIEKNQTDESNVQQKYDK